MKGQIKNIKDVKRFMFAGNVTFMAQSDKSGIFLPIKVKLAPKATKGNSLPWFVSAKKSLDNVPHRYPYEYIGHIRMDSQYTAFSYVHGENSIYTPTHKTSKAIRHIIEAILKETPNPGFTIWHYGRCGRCGRKLTDIESICTGFGPTCRKLVLEGKTSQTTEKCPF